MYLVTGGAGFIGSHIVQRIVAMGKEVRVLDNLSFGKEENLRGLEDKQILLSQLRINSSVLASINSSTPLLGRGIGLDSIETLALVAGMEEEFGIEVDDADLTVDLFRNIGTLVE
jgi:acyl carrier protein